MFAFGFMASVMPTIQEFIAQVEWAGKTPEFEAAVLAMFTSNELTVRFSNCLLAHLRCAVSWQVLNHFEGLTYEELSWPEGCDWHAFK